jgi:hypothetical protein
MKTQIWKWLTVIVTFISLLFLVTGLEAKKDGEKPDKPVQTESECIIFGGEDLLGGEVVEDCCPNTGPFPVYGLTLLGTPHVGQLFINNYGVGRNHGYIVQFWNDFVWFEITGGEVVNDKKNKILTVIFDDEWATLEEFDEDKSRNVSFDLLRTSDLSDCP